MFNIRLKLQISVKPRAIATKSHLVDSYFPFKTFVMALTFLNASSYSYFHKVREEFRCLLKTVIDTK